MGGILRPTLKSPSQKVTLRVPPGEPRIFYSNFSLYLDGGGLIVEWAYNCVYPKG